MDKNIMWFKVDREINFYPYEIKNKIKDAFIRKLKPYFADVDENKKLICRTTLISFAISLTELINIEKVLLKSTPTIKYNNGGGQRGIKDNPLYDRRDKLTKTMIILYRQLLSLKSDYIAEDDPFLEFIKKK